jgi:hypothetical protein
MLVTLLTPILELQHAPLSPKCCEPGSMSHLLILSLLQFRFTFESIICEFVLVLARSFNGFLPSKCCKLRKVPQFFSFFFNLSLLRSLRVCHITCNQFDKNDQLDK